MHARNAQRVRATGRGPRKMQGDALEAPSVRQCAVCREKLPAERMLQLGTGVFEDGSVKRGRAAYVCIALSCLKGMQARALGKALKGPVDGPLPDELIAEIHVLATSKIMGLIGLARRQGALVPGIERVKESLHPLGLVLVAEDASPRTQRQLSEPTLFGTIESLAKATGLQALAVVGIQAGRLAMQAAYWLRVW
jgi:predicted RNA-binding protein YlxR (DUF448 family)